MIKISCSFFLFDIDAKRKKRTKSLLKKILKSTKSLNIVTPFCTKINFWQKKAKRETLFSLRGELGLMPSYKTKEAI